MNPTAENLKGRCMDRQLARAKRQELSKWTHTRLHKREQEAAAEAGDSSTDINKKKPIDAWLISALGLFYRLLWLQLFS
jgi:hypothetical protein